MDKEPEDYEFQDGRFLRKFWGRSMSRVWKHFNFEVDCNGVYLDKTAAYCLMCQTKMKYCGNTTNLANHLLRRHPQLGSTTSPSHTKVFEGHEGSDLYIKQEVQDQTIADHLEDSDERQSSKYPITPGDIKTEAFESAENSDVTILKSFWGDCSSSVWDSFKFEVDEDGKYVNTKVSVCTLCECSLYYNGNSEILQSHLDSEHGELQSAGQANDEMEATTSTDTTPEEYVKNVVSICTIEAKLKHEIPVKVLTSPPRTRTPGKRFYKPFWGNATSAVWEHFKFEVDENGLYMNKEVVHCQHCDSQLKYCHNTTNMGYHLERWHNIPRKFVLPSNNAARKRPCHRFINSSAFKHIRSLVSMNSVKEIPTPDKSEIMNSKIVKKAPQSDRKPAPGQVVFLKQAFMKDDANDEPKHFRSYWGDCEAPIWQYFHFEADEKNNYVDRTAVYCTLCGVRLALLTMTSCLKQHLRKWHFEEYNSLKSDFLSKPIEPIIVAVDVPKYPFLQSIAEHFITDLRPISDIDSPSFRKMFLTAYPNQVLPHRLRFQQGILTPIYEHEKIKFTSEISKVDRHSLTVEWWKSNFNQNYITFKVHYISDAWTTVSKVIRTWNIGEHPTPHNVACKLSSLVQEWQLKDPVVVMDNNFVMSEAVTNVLNWPNVTAVNYSVDLSVKKVFMLSRVEEILSNVRNIFAQLQHVQHSAQIKQKQIQLHLPERDLLREFDESRWTETLEMLILFVEQWPIMRSIIIDCDLPHSLLVSHTGFKHLRDLIDTLEVFRVATAYMSSARQHTVSVIAPMLVKLKNCLKVGAHDSEFRMEVKLLMCEVIESKYGQQDIQMLLKKASALDPRMKKLHFLSTSEQDVVKKLLQQEAMALAQEHVTADKRTNDGSGDDSDENMHDEGKTQAKIPRMVEPSMSDWLGDIVSVKGDNTVGEKIEAEMKLFLCEPDVMFDDSPVKWWQHKWTMYPLLSPLAKRYMCIPAICVETDRDIQMKRRCLQNDTVNMQLFLQQQNFVT